MAEQGDSGDFKQVGKVVDPGWGLSAPIPGVDDKLPDKLGDMDVTPEVKKLYMGNPVMLAMRSMHSPQCQKPFDAMIMCTRNLLEETICEQVITAFKPCAQEMKRKRLLSAKLAEEKRARELMAKSKALQEAQSK